MACAWPSLTYGRLGRLGSQREVLVLRSEQHQFDLLMAVVSEQSAKPALTAGIDVWYDISPSHMSEAFISRLGQSRLASEAFWIMFEASSQVSDADGGADDCSRPEGRL